MGAGPYDRVEVDTVTSSTRDRPAALELSRAEAWVVHAALLAAIERAVEADEDPERERRLLAAVEGGDHEFDRRELRRIREVLESYLDDAPPRDRPHGRAVAGDIEAALAD